MITIPDYWADCRVWQTRKNGMCKDAIGDVFFLFGQKFILYRN